MKKIFTLVLGLGLSLSAVHAQKDVKLNANNIDEVVAAMTLEEKAHMVNGIGVSGEVMLLVAMKETFLVLLEDLMTFLVWVFLHSILVTDH